MTEEDFDAWLALPVTQHVLKWAKQYSEEARKQWVELSWDNGDCDPVKLADLKAQSALAEDFSNVSYEDISDGEPERDRAT